MVHSLLQKLQEKWACSFALTSSVIYTNTNISIIVKNRKRIHIEHCVVHIVYLLSPFVELVKNNEEKILKKE